MVLKELIFNSFLLWAGVQWSSRKLFLTVSTLGGCGGLEGYDLVTVSTLAGCHGLEKTDF